MSAVVLWLPLILHCCCSWWMCIATLPTIDEPSASMWLCKELREAVVAWLQFTFLNYSRGVQLYYFGLRVYFSSAEMELYLRPQIQALLHVVVLPVSDSSIPVGQHLNKHARNRSMGHSPDSLMLALIHCWNQPHCLQLPRKINSSWVTRGLLEAILSKRC